MNKDQYAHEEDMERRPKSPTSSQEYDSIFSEAQYRKIVHRIDRRLITVVGVRPIQCVFRVQGLANTTEVDVLRQFDGPFESCGCSCS